MTKQSETGRGSSYELYDQVSGTLTDIMKEHVSNIKQMTNLIWLVVAVMNGKSIALSQLANLLPGAGEAKSRVTRIREWLKNSKVEVWTLYQAVLREVLRDWHETTMSLIVDGTLVFGGRLQIFRLSLAHGNRAIPLAWRVVPGTGLVQAERLRPMFRQVAEFLMRYQARITLLADRGFRDHDWALLCKDLGWGYCIRIVRSTHIRLRTGATVRLDALKPRMGRTLCLSRVILTQQHAFATHVSMTWSRGEGAAAPERVIVISDQRAHPDRLREYAVRMDIEIVQSQMTKAGAFAILGSGDDVTDFDIAIGDDHAINQEFNQLPLVLKRGAGQASLDTLTELGHRTGDCGKLRVLIGLTIQLLILTRQCINLALHLFKHVLRHNGRDGSRQEPLDSLRNKS